MNPFAIPGEVYAAGLVFARVGAIVMLLPGIGEQVVPPRIRLSFALLMAVCIGPVVAPLLPAIPASLGAMGGQVIKEVLTGLMIGTLMRLMLSTLATAGETISLQTTLSFSQTANPLGAQPGTSLTTFLTLLGVALIFATNLHHLFLAGMVRSYTLFAPAKPMMISDAVALAVQTIGGSFALGIQLAAPVIVFSIVFNIAIGLVGRVMPQFQIFFVAAPLSIIFGLSIFALSLGLIGLVWIGAYEDFLRIFT